MSRTPGPAVPDPRLSIVITVVEGAAALRRCLARLRPQAEALGAEIIVPYDAWCADVQALVDEFPDVRWQPVDDLGAAAAVRSRRDHRLFDRRRAAGLAVARGQLVAMTEDRSVPAADWCAQLVAAHAQPAAAIGGAIDNAVDRPMNWALYYCDFGRYGRPLQPGPAAYVSDVNVAYRRAALESIRPVWSAAYHETTVHWALQARGETILLDPRPVILQDRPPIGLAAAYRERIAFARGFAATRAAACSGWHRALYALGTPLLPFVLALRVAHHMRRQRRTGAQLAHVLPLAFLLLTGWALGELIGYVAPLRPRTSL